MRKKYLSFFLLSLFLMNLSAIFIKPVKAETMNWFLVDTINDTFYDDEYIISFDYPDLTDYLSHPPPAQIWTFISAEIDVHVVITTIGGVFTIPTSSVSFIDTDTTLPVAFTLHNSGYTGGVYPPWTAFRWYKTGAETTTNYEISLDYDLSYVLDYQISIAYYVKINYSVSNVWVNLLITNTMRFIKVFLVFFLAFVLKREFGQIAFPIGLLAGSIIFYISGIISNFENLFLIMISFLIFYIQLKKKRTLESEDL